MFASVRVGEHVRRNAVAYVALFVALTGTSYAATKITSKDIKKDAVLAKHVKDGQLTGGDVADDALTGQDVNEATLQGLNGELNAFRAQLQNPGALNAAGNPVDFTELKNVPAGFADGTDNVGSAPGNNSLGVAEPGGAAEDEILDGTIDTEDVTNGSLVDADIATAAAIDDAKLGTINDPGKVADAALSSNVALLNAADQTFSGNLGLLGNVTATPDDGEEFDVFATRTGATAGNVLDVRLNNVTASGFQGIAQLGNLVSSGTTERILGINNFDPNDPVANGIEFIGNVFTTAINAADPEIDTALDIGANDIQTSGATISATELETLDGIPTRMVSLPVSSFLNVSTTGPLDFDSTNDSNAPDFALANGTPVIDFDAAGGANDSDDIASSFTVPADFAGSPTIRVRASKGGHGGTPERLRCAVSLNGASTGPFGTMTTTSSANTAYSIVPTNAGSFAPGDSAGVGCDVDDGANGVVYDDLVRIFSIAFEYSATR